MRNHRLKQAAIFYALENPSFDEIMLEVLTVRVIILPICSLVRLYFSVAMAMPAVTLP